ncbi:hypothetical protein PC129_g21107 [Phytophthora cactorum]|uniref:Uncharacterized protein n=1 Tax=Phytophthora cactorum TaxID=29920 RepID=A0A8T1H708_9STRA|nr:hypothetical protein PC113_g22367 [Phytophthora cactorum]KAG3080389.1 hypothetical protein PC121_g6733 [Phytophthora cactorum]KAG3110028.1 hypothetical protein PI125_g10383 [Phytophthora idaei]KAG3207856.1 hypothetical protein PC129_g21107 [Phytophthora cactorum]
MADIVNSIRLSPLGNTEVALAPAAFEGDCKNCDHVHNEAETATDDYSGDSDWAPGSDDGLSGDELADSSGEKVVDADAAFERQ